MAENTNSKFPTEAEVVIVGVGGIVGYMLAYCLSDLGQKIIVGLEKSRNLMTVRIAQDLGLKK